jgi:hypothetical protein
VGNVGEVWAGVVERQVAVVCGILFEPGKAAVWLAKRAACSVDGQFVAGGAMPGACCGCTLSLIQVYQCWGLGLQPWQ